MMPSKRRFDKAVIYLQDYIPSHTEEGIIRNIRLLDKAASQKDKSMMSEILTKRSLTNFTNGR